MSSSESDYRQAIAAYLFCHEEDIFFYWKGRVALYALLKAMGVKAGDEVIVQGYTCVVVANAIIYLGATPAYVDIDLDTFNMNLDSLRQKVTARTKVIICQNTYGLSSNLETLQQIARDTARQYGHAVYTLEDCTHGFGGTYHGKPNGTSCDASFFSTQWSKPYTTGVGGFCVVHNDAVKDALQKLEAEKIRPSLKEILQLKLMYFVRAYIINDFTYWPMIRLYRWLSRHNLVVGSSSGEEVTGVEMPLDFFKAQSDTQFKKGLAALKRLPAVNVLRRENAKKYTSFLRSIGKNHVDEALFGDHIFIRYPLLVKDRKAFRDLAEDARIILGEWFEGPIYPAYDSLDIWKVKTEELPNAMFVCEHIVNLPTDEKDVGRVIQFLSEHRDYVL